MTQLCSNYGRVLSQLDITPEEVEETKRILQTEEELVQVLDSKTVPVSSKHAIIKKVFPVSIQNFLKIICNYHSISFATDMDEVFTVYETCRRDEENILPAVLSYVIPPTTEQLSGLRHFLENKYQDKKIQLICKTDEQLLGGFKIQVQDLEYDWSIKGKMMRLQQKLTGR